MYDEWRQAARVKTKFDRDCSHLVAGETITGHLLITRYENMEFEVTLELECREKRHFD
jgi:hypothetical protein